MNIGFIGAGGNMAGAIIDSLLSSEIVFDNIYLYSPHTEKLERFKADNVHICPSNSDVLKQSDYIFLCVKPQILPQVLKEIRPSAKQSHCFVSIAAGIRIDDIKFALGFDAKVIRVMPNTPLQIGLGASGICAVSPVTVDELHFVCNVFGGSNTSVVVDEDKMDAVTAVSGSGPAYVYRFIKDIALEGQALGLDFDKSLQLTLATVSGAVEMIKHTECTPEALDMLIKSVTSPNGTTYAALSSMDKDNFDLAVKNAVDACAKRSMELSEKK